MLTEQQKETMNLLREALEECFGTVEAAEQSEITFLRLMPALFEDETGQVYMEICFLDYSEEVTIAQVYTTLLMEPGPGLAAIREKLGEWNLHSFSGAYGIYEEQGQLYHKQNISFINEAAVDDQVDLLFAGICVALDEMTRRLPEAVAMNEGKDNGSA
ncbi:MAG: hypothetical protein LUC21_07765 [Oscillospiraceae bacterium]|nr:hypothetical protein [Oscillospiraceae bacterium]MCD8390033.1 hypothetical protein [Oscillospiraceae bacterium]